MQLKIKEKVDEAAEMGELNSRAWDREQVPSRDMPARIRQERAQVETTDDGDKSERVSKSEHKLGHVGERSAFRRDERRAERREPREERQPEERRVEMREERWQERLSERQKELGSEHRERDRRPKHRHFSYNPMPRDLCRDHGERVSRH